MAPGLYHWDHLGMRPARCHGGQSGGLRLRLRLPGLPVATTRRLIERGCGPRASVVYPERGQIVYTLSELAVHQGWVEVVYYNEAVNIFVRGFVTPYSSALSVWSVPEVLLLSGLLLMSTTECVVRVSRGLRVSSL